MQKKPFTELGLSPDVIRAVARMGFEETTPIQSATIPLMLDGRDVVGQSQTGSGKTAAFAIPIIERIDPARRVPQALVLCPTRELAVQVAEEVSKLALYKKGLRELPIYGGASYERQFRGLESGVQIIIGTPGRLIDHLERGSLKLDAVQTVVLDEADRMLDMGFRDDIEAILSKAPTSRQTVFFSATLPPPIRRMIERFTRDPVPVAIDSENVTAPEIEQVYYEVDPRSRLEVLCRLIDMRDIKRGIIFCGTKAMVDELTEHLLARGYNADRLHGDMAQMMRERVMRRFRDGRVELLVATDVAARGLDVDDVEVVFNYDLPYDAEDYVHRIGRTGRAGRSGRAVTFVAGREAWRFAQFMRLTRSRPRLERAPTLSEVEERHSSRLSESLRETLAAGCFTRHEEVINPLLDAGHSPTDIASALIHLLTEETQRVFENIAEDHTPRRQFERPGAPRDTSQGTDTPAKSRPKSRAAEAGQATPRRDRDKRGDSRKHAPAGRGVGVLRIGLGRKHHVQAGDILGFVAGAGGLARGDVGAIRLFPTHSLVEINLGDPGALAERLGKLRFKGHKVRVDVAE